jgi:hypothetical protein
MLARPILMLYSMEVVRQSPLMIYFEFDDSNFNYQGHVGDSNNIVERSKFSTVIEIQADGDELERCCEILGRELPPNRVYTFLGVNAQEIARNWQ